MEKVKLHELVDIYLGVTHTPDYIFEGVPFLSVKDISGGKICFEDCKYISQKEYDSLSEGAKPKVGDMLFCRVGTIGKPIIIPEGTPLFGSFVSLGYLRNRNSDRCDLNYLKYWMYSRSFWKQVDANVKGASQVNLNTGWLSKFDIDLPGIEEQRYRISVLDKCKSVIEKRKDELSILDDLIRARFVEMFGNIKENRFIKCKMREVAHIKHGYAYSGEYFSDKDNGVVLVTPGNFALGGGFQEIKNKYFTSKYPEEYVLHPGDLIVTMTDLSKKADTLGYGAIIPDNTSKIYLHNQRIGLFDELDKRLNPVFVRWFMQTDEYRLEIVKTSTGSTVHHTSPDRILDSLIFLPPIQLQNDFVKFANQVDKSKVILPKLSFNVII